MNCNKGPLDLRNSIDFRKEGVCQVMKVACASFDNIKRSPDYRCEISCRTRHSSFWSRTCTLLGTSFNAWFVVSVFE